MPASLTLTAKTPGVLDELVPRVGLYPRTGLYPNVGGLATKTHGVLSVTVHSSGTLTLTPNP